MEHKIFTLPGIQLPDTGVWRGEVAVPGAGYSLPTTVVKGSRPGKTVLVTAGVHSCEYVGVAALIELAAQLPPQDMRGTVVLIGPVNRPGFEERLPTRMPADGKNLNRVFPGSATGTVSQRVAAFFVEVLFPQMDFYMDLHGGAIYEELSVPYLYYVGAADPTVSRLARQAACHTSAAYMVRSSARTGAYNWAGVMGVPSLLLERGSGGRWTAQEAAAMALDVSAVLGFLEVLPAVAAPAATPVELETLYYPLARAAGLWRPAVCAGQRIQKGQLLGTMTDYFGTVIDRYVAEADGVVLYLTTTLRADTETELVAYAAL